MRVFRGELRDAIDLLAFGPGERLAAAGAGRGRVDVWNAVTGHQADPWWVRDQRYRELSVSDLGFLPGGRVLACVRENQLLMFDPDTSADGTEFPVVPGAIRVGPAVRLAASAG